MTDKANPRVTTVLPRGQEQKDEWDRWQEDHPEASSISHLIRLSVRNEMKAVENGGRESGQAGGMSEEVADKLAEVIETNQAVVNQIENLQNRMRALENQAGEDPVIAEIKNDVFAILPTPDKVEAFDEFPGGFEAYAEQVEGVVTREGNVDYERLTTVASGEPADIARVLDEREATVEKALEALESDTARVRQTDDGRWVKEV